MYTRTEALVPKTSQIYTQLVTQGENKTNTVRQKKYIPKNTIRKKPFSSIIRYDEVINEILLAAIHFYFLAV